MNQENYEDVQTAIDKKDIFSLCSYLCTEINLDPKFESNRFDEMLTYIKVRGIEIELPYEKQLDEFKLSRDQWTDLYFYRLTEWLRENFAPKERLPHIKEVGQAVFPEQRKAAKPDFQAAPQETKAPPRHAPAQKKSGKSAAAVAVVVAAIALVALIVKLFK